MSALSEDDAKERFCYRWAADPARHETHGKCKASGCMAWRWADPATRPRHPEGKSRLAYALEETPNRRGFCGLAGNAGEPT